MFRIALVGGLGLLPLWIAIVKLVSGSYPNQPPDYWNVAPWILLPGLVASAVTFVIAIAVSGALERGIARHASGLRIGLARSSKVAAVVSLAALAAWWHGQNTEAENRALALQLAKSDGSISRAVGAHPTPIISLVTIIRGEKYDVTVHGNGTIHAIISVSKVNGKRTAKLDCIARYPANPKDPSTDPCAPT